NDPLLGFFVGWIRVLAEKFDVVEVICLGVGAYSLPSHVTVRSLGKERGFSKLRYLWRFYRFFSTGYKDAEYVFFHMGAIMNVLAFPFFILSRFSGPKFVWWKAHGHINWFGRLASVGVDEVVTSTASGYPIDTSKRRIIGQAIDTDLFTFDPAVTRDEKHVVFVGRLMPIKQLEVFVDVARALESHGYTFSVIGPVGDEAYCAGLRQSAADTNIAWLGSRTQMELVEVYQTAGVFLNTSLTHSMDKTVLEAILCGCIPLTANRAFASMLGPHGLYTKTQSAEQYQTIITGLGADPRTDIRTRLRAEVMKEHSLLTLPDRIFTVSSQI
ncbi:MAG: glycosyltransferase, partial [Bacteroidota bacterium]